MVHATHRRNHENNVCFKPVPEGDIVVTQNKALNLDTSTPKSASSISVELHQQQMIIYALTAGGSFAELEYKMQRNPAGRRLYLV